MKKHKTSILSKGIFKTVRWLVRLFYGKTDIVGIENMPEKDVIVVANHAQMNGPIIGELFMQHPSGVRSSHSAYDSEPGSHSY